MSRLTSSLTTAVLTRVPGEKDIIETLIVSGPSCSVHDTTTHGIPRFRKMNLLQTGGLVAHAPLAVIACGVVWGTHGVNTRQTRPQFHGNLRLKQGGDLSLADRSKRRIRRHSERYRKACDLRKHLATDSWSQQCLETMVSGPEQLFLQRTSAPHVIGEDT